jgi:hypothetical protein
MWVRVIVFNITFNNISAISWWSVLLVEDTRVPEKTTDLPQATHKFYHIMLYGVHLAWAGFKLTRLLYIFNLCVNCPIPFDMQNNKVKLEADMSLYR